MGLHKLTAGDGYLYLLRQVAAADDSGRGRGSLAEYYSAKGEAPGRWMGRGLATLAAPDGRDPSDPLVARLWSVPEGSQVTEEQMKALFGEGLHPNADAITNHLIAKGLGHRPAVAAAWLGRPFRINITESEFTARLRAAYAAHNGAIGAADAAAIDEQTKAGLRTDVGREMFTEHYERPPADERELSGFIARQTRSQTSAVAGYDLTFTPVKSVSVLWAIAPRHIAEVIEDCHHQAVEETIEFLEETAAFSRMGANGVEQVNTTGLIAAAFDHRDSRAGDPNLHTHVVISNKVRAIGADGIERWLALDGEPLYRANVAASEMYNTRIEALLIQGLGVTCGEVSHSGAGGKRPVREIVGIPVELLRLFSSRSAAIERRVGELAKAFQTQRGREPTAVEHLALSEQANLDTRQAKHEPRSLAEQRHTWRTQAIEILGGQHELTQLVCATTASRIPALAQQLGREWIDQQAQAVVAAVAQSRATWQIHHIRAEAQRRLRYTDHAGGPVAANAIVAAALADHSLALSTHTDTEMGEPAALRRADGASAYTRHDTTVYTSQSVLDAERRIIAAAGRGGARVVDADDIELALLEQHAHGVQLNDGQVALVRRMASSGARVQLALAPAGTGKTTAMATLAAAWRNSGGTVIGLAPTARAAEVLAEDLAAPTDTIAKLVQLRGQHPGMAAAVDDPARGWFDRIGADTLLIVDEAGKAATADLDTVISHALATGATVRLVGDDQQLASISAGGVLRDLADRYDVLTLDRVLRFGDTERGRAEGAASLALRRGDQAGIGFYLDHQRVHVGADAVAADMAYHAWAADTAAGRDAILLAPTNALVAELNQRARLDRLQRDPAEPSSTVTLADGLTASVGDWITTRRNARWLRSGRGRWVKNGQRWVIEHIGEDGSLTVRPLRGPATMTVRLPAGYVADHTTVGYAATIDSEQGVTADVARIVGSDRLTRQQLYVALTRGRDENHIYFSTAEADPHRILAPKAAHPPTAADILTTIVGRDDTQLSAHSAIAAEHDPAARLPHAAAMYTDALTAAALHTAGPDVLARIDDTAAALPIPELTESEAWPVLRRTLALTALHGQDPVAALQEAAARPVDDAADPAAVLDWRIHAAADKPGPLIWLSAVPDVLARDEQWGPYLAARAQRVTELADQIRADMLAADAAHPPPWARPLHGVRPRMRAEIAVFRAAHNVDAADTRITGPQQHATRSAAFQKLVHHGLAHAATREQPAPNRWRTPAEQLSPRITDDPYWPQLATHLDQAADAGADIPTLLSDVLARGGPLPDELPAAALYWRLTGRQPEHTQTHRPAGDDLAAQPYDLGAELPALRAEVDFLDAAGGRAPAAMYRVPDEALDTLDNKAQAAVIAIANSAQGIHALHLGEDADKPAVLTALTAAAHHHNQHAVAMPATVATAHDRDEYNYAPAADPRVDRLKTLPIGSLLIVDDADHLTPAQLHALAGNAANTNTKLVLVSAQTPGPSPSRELLTAAHRHLPWSHQLGTPQLAQPPTAIERAEAHIAATADTGSPALDAATALLARRDDLVQRYTRTEAAHEHRLATLRSRERSRSQDGYSLGL